MPSWFDADNHALCTVILSRRDIPPFFAAEPLPGLGSLQLRTFVRSDFCSTSWRAAAASMPAIIRPEDVARSREPALTVWVTTFQTFAQIDVILEFSWRLV